MKLSWQGSAYLCSFWLLCAPALAFAQMEHVHPPASEEDCAKLSPGLQAVVATMETAGSRVETVTQRGQMPALESGMKSLVLVLHRMSTVHPVAGRLKAGENPETVFGGFILLKIPHDGQYRISADSALWVDVLDGDQTMERSKSVSRLHCGRIQKSLIFSLKSGTLYWLELSGSKKAEVALVVTAE